MVSTWQMGKHLRFNTFREIFLAANALDNISSLAPLLEKGSAAGHGRGGYRRHFLEWSDALDTSPHRGRRVKPGVDWKGQGVHSLEEQLERTTGSPRWRSWRFIQSKQTILWMEKLRSRDEVVIPTAEQGQSSCLNRVSWLSGWCFHFPGMPVGTMEEYKTKVSPSQFRWLSGPLAAETWGPWVLNRRWVWPKDSLLISPRFSPL